MVQCSNSGEEHYGSCRQSRRHHRSRERHRPRGRDRAGAPQGASDGARRPRREQSTASPTKINAEVGKKVAFPYRGDATDAKFRASVFDSISSEFDTVTMCVPAAGITRDDLAVRIDKVSGKARIYPVGPVQAGDGRESRAPVYWALEMIGRIAENRAARGLARWHPSERMQGRIVFIGSVSSQGNRGQISYASAKAGLEGAAATIMKEAVLHGVRCGLIHPGFTDTPMVRSMGDDYIDKHILPFTQLSRLIRPDEIADAICFMLANSAVSGELWADAGWHAPA
jgi:NAD(P)-dependent dehydrogenase (short-subunit alcohol dehydrogenase family)